MISAVLPLISHVFFPYATTERFRQLQLWPCRYHTHTRSLSALLDSSLALVFSAQRMLYALNLTFKSMLLRNCLSMVADGFLRLRGGYSVEMPPDGRASRIVLAEEALYTPFLWPRCFHEGARTKMTALSTGLATLVISPGKLAKPRFRTRSRRRTMHTAVWSSAAMANECTGNPEYIAPSEGRIDWAIIHQSAVSYEILRRLVGWIVWSKACDGVS